jgi:hypothetical protein
MLIVLQLNSMLKLATFHVIHSLNLGHVQQKPIKSNTTVYIERQNIFIFRYFLHSLR